jgi:hypothetical protein
MRCAVAAARGHEIAAHTRRPVTPELSSVNHVRSSEDGYLAFGILNQFSVGVLLDQSAKVLFANAAAQSMAEKGGPLRGKSGVVGLSSEHARQLGRPLCAQW